MNWIILGDTLINLNQVVKVKAIRDGPTEPVNHLIFYHPVYDDDNGDLAYTFVSYQDTEDLEGDYKYLLKRLEGTM